MGKGRIPGVRWCAAVVVVACGGSALAGTIQYDSGGWDYQNPPLGGQAVLFTVPSGFGPVWRAETLSILTIGSPTAAVPITVKVWEDSAGSMGDVLFEYSSSVSGNYWHWCDFDLSGADLRFSAGESFFAGFDQATEVHGCWDEEDPDHGRGYYRWSWSSTWGSNADDAMIRVSGTTAVVPVPPALGLAVLGALAVVRARRGVKR